MLSSDVEILEDHKQLWLVPVKRQEASHFSAGSMSQPSIKSPDINNATKLLNWIKSHELKETSPRHLQQYSPIREKSKRDKAISLLIEHQYVKETTTNNKTLLHINPHG